MSTFGAKNPCDVDTYVVNFNAMSKDNSPLPLHAYVVNKITGPIQRGPLQSAYLEFLVSISSEKWLTLFLKLQNQLILTF